MPKTPACLLCGGTDLRAVVTLTRMLPLSTRGDSVRVTGSEAAVTKLDLKSSWMNEEDGSLKKVRGPIYCLDCGAEHAYHHDGRNSGLRLVEQNG